MEKCNQLTPLPFKALTQHKHILGLFSTDNKSHITFCAAQVTGLTSVDWSCSSVYTRQTGAGSSP